MTRTRRIAERGLSAPHLPVAGYLIYVGLRAVTHPDQTRVATGLLPGWFTFAWGAAFLLGGLLIFLGVLTGRTRAESAGHGFHLAALAIYAAAALIGDRFGVGLVVILAVLAAVSALRLRQLGKQREAAAVAGCILDGDAR